MFFSREGELRAFKHLAERGFGPSLLATLEDGRVEEFLEGKVSRLPLIEMGTQYAKQLHLTRKVDQQGGCKRSSGTAALLCVVKLAANGSMKRGSFSA